MLIKKSTRLICFVLTLCISLTILFENIYIFENFNHKCVGNDCIVCHNIKQIQNEYYKLLDLFNISFKIIPLIIFLFYIKYNI